MASYTYPPPYCGPRNAPSPLPNYYQAQSRYLSPRYTSKGDHATNQRISAAPQPCAASHHIRHSRARGTSDTYSSASTRSFFANPPPRYDNASAFRYANLPGIVSDDEFMEIEENVFIHIMNGSPVHYGRNCYQHELHANEKERFGRREKTNQYAHQGLNYDDDGKPFIFTAAPRFDEPKRAWARAASTSTPRRRTAIRTKKAPLPKATEGDAWAHGIPAGFSLENWDPTETPILLLGSVFDANSLGKWIYDWTVFRHGPGMPISDVAGELWLLLIKLAGKVKQSEECMSRIRREEDGCMVGRFVGDGEKLMDILTQLLKACEGPMLEAGRKKEAEGVLEDNAGVVFVETLFGRERQLEKTENFMTRSRLWDMRFDANCKQILSRQRT